MSNLAFAIATNRLLGGKVQHPTVPEHLRSGAATYEDRNKTYGDNYKNFGPVMAAMFPKGLLLRTPGQWNRFGIFVQIMTKITRLAESDFLHTDSAHDTMVYAAMLRELQELDHVDL